MPWNDPRPNLSHRHRHSANNPKLRRIARRRRQAQMSKGRASQQAPARRALHEALLHQIRLDDLLDRVSRLAEGGGDGLRPDRSAAEGFRDEPQVALVEGVQAPVIDLQPRQRRIGDLRVDAGLPGHGREIAHARFSRRPAMRGVPRARPAISRAPSCVMSSDSTRAPRSTMETSSSAE